MLSSNRFVPKALAKEKEASVSANNQFILEEEEFKKSSVQEYIKNSIKRVELKEQEALMEIEQKKEELKEKAYQEGYQRAVEEAKQLVKQELDDEFKKVEVLYEKANQVLQKAVLEAEKNMEYLIEHNKLDLIELVITATKKIIHKEMDKEPERIEEIFRETVKEIKHETSAIYVKIHPSSETFIEQVGRHMFKGKVQIRYDFSLQPHDLIIETEREIIDASIQKQLEELRTLLRSEIN